MSLISYVNQPDRVFINSSDDNTSSTYGFYNIFQVNYKTPILGAKRCQLLRATIPNIVQNIPNYAIYFFYISSTSATGPYALTDVGCIRFLPTGYVPTSGAYSVNRYISNYTDFVSLLNNACINDNAGYNPYFKSGDITFSLNSTTNTISFTGNTSGNYYRIIAWDDPLIALAMANISLPPGNACNNSSNSNSVNYVNGYTLNLRCGYSQPSSQYGLTASTKTVTNGTAIPADTWPNLTYSQCIYIYANIVAGSSLGSGNQHNLLSVVPITAPQLGVSQYVALTLNWLTKVSDNIYNITITMLDDANQPFYLSDSAQVNIEMGFKYDE